ncbi:MAG TPA: DUF1844 domain-containing protein [Acidobacteriaceae bacterium]|nr:DUF1844 domain-containing protein [Acidobacteriaceae bacterium]
MHEKEPQVTFTDRRKISSDGEIRPEAAAQSAAEHRETERREPEQRHSAVDAARSEAAGSTQSPAASAASQGSGTSTSSRAPESSESSRVQDAAMPPGPTAQENAESNAAYQQTTRELDDLLRAKSPDSARLGPVGFEHLVQSMYMTAMMAMGAGTQPGEKPRIDLMGARQTIDLLGVLSEKTKGNLTDSEHRLLDSALFELRMMFLEITNAIARKASNPGPQAAPPPKRR